MGTVIHTSVSVRDALDWPKNKLRGMFRDELGRPVSADEARHLLMEALSQGTERLSVGDPCEGFDPKKGCPGHRR
jgi:hypothetical protein